MDSIHICFKEREIDLDNTFTANVSQENEVENVVFNTDTEYADRISKEIPKKIKNFKDFDLTLTISNPETKTLLLPFVKKDEFHLPKIKLTCFNTTTKKMRIF